VYYHEGIAQLQLRNNEEALRCFQKAIDLSEGRYAGAEFGYGLVLLREGEGEEAERMVRHPWKQIRTVWKARWFWGSCC
jgi:tetratricopeptide (TPR) repeat protein